MAPQWRKYTREMCCNLSGTAKLEEGEGADLDALRFQQDNSIANGRSLKADFAPRNEEALLQIAQGRELHSSTVDFPICKLESQQPTCAQGKCSSGQHLPSLATAEQSTLALFEVL